VIVPSKLSSKGARLIADFEGFRPNWYRDAVGVRTIGYGHTGALPAGFHAPLTRAEGLRLLQHDAASASKAVASIRPRILRQSRFDAIVSFVFNLGPGAIGSGSTMGQALRKRVGRAGAVSRSFTLYDHAGGKVLQGLLNRRLREKRLWDTGSY
jgi:lysozyme